MSKIIAVEDKIIMEPIKRDQMTEGGLFIPETATGHIPQKCGKVISVGNKVEKIKEGDIIMCHERAGMDIVLGKSTYKVLVINEVYAIIEED